MEDAANLIAGEVDVIINSAATTTFDGRYIPRPAFGHIICLHMLCPSDSLISDSWADITHDISTKGAARILNFAKKCEITCCKCMYYFKLQMTMCTRLPHLLQILCLPIHKENPIHISAFQHSMYSNAGLTITKLRN